MAEVYNTTELGLSVWRHRALGESVKKHAQQQIIILCERDGITIEDLVHDFSLPFTGTDTEATLHTRRVFDYAIDNIKRLVDGLVQQGHLEVHND